ERARIDEAAGRDSGAASGYAAALDDLEPGPTQLQAGLGLLRSVCRLAAAAAAAPATSAKAPGEAAARDQPAQLLRGALAALTVAVPPSPLRSALLRRAALVAEAPEERRALLTTASEGGDRLALEDLGRLLAEAGAFSEAAQCYAGIAERSSDAARRA